VPSLRNWRMSCSRPAPIVASSVAVVWMSSIFPVVVVPDLIAAKREGGHTALLSGVVPRLATDVPGQRAELEAARDASTLPDRPDPATMDALHDLVVRTRLG
jgi:hypothetical protein